MTRPRRMRAALLSGLVCVLSLGVLAQPATAACHSASFVTSNVEADEADGSVTVTIFLVGRQPSCAGTVDWTTADGTATAGEDYEAASGTATFASGDDREEAVTITLLDDTAAESAETFTIELSNPTGGITSASATATVTVADDDGTADGGGSDGGGEESTDDGGSPVVPIVVAVVVVGGIAGFVVSRRR